ESSGSFSAKLISLLEPAQRRAALVLVGLTLIGTFLEAIGIGFTLPAIALMTTSDVASRYPQIKPLIAALGYPTQTQLVMIGMGALVGLYLLKDAFLAFLSWRQGQFIFGLNLRLSHRLFANYLRQPYAFHLERNSAQLIRNATTEVNVFTNAMQSIVALGTEG